MFYYISGKAGLKGDNFVVVDAGGVGYKIYTSVLDIEKIKLDADIKMYTYTYIREDMFDIYGFLSESELSLFEKLLSVSGVGPKAAISVLSVASADKIALAIVTGDTDIIKKASGVGAKVASRIVLELKDKLSNAAIASDGAKELVSSVVTGKMSATGEAIEALVTLGYSQAEAKSALSGIDMTMDIELIIKQALMKLMR